MQNFLFLFGLSIFKIKFEMCLPIFGCLRIFIWFLNLYFVFLIFFASVYRVFSGFLCQLNVIFDLRKNMGLIELPKRRRICNSFR